MPTRSERHSSAAAFLAVMILAGCGEPSNRERLNRREFEALLTAISLRDRRELETDVRRIESRHDSGEMSDARFADLRAIIDQARLGNWTDAETQAYGFRAAHPYFR